LRGCLGLEAIEARLRNYILIHFYTKNLAIVFSIWTKIQVLKFIPNIRDF